MPFGLLNTLSVSIRLMSPVPAIRYPTGSEVSDIEETAALEE